MGAGHAPKNGRLVIRDVNVSGWHVSCVEPTGGHHGWAFSVGFLQTFGHPEVAIFGLPVDVERTLLDAIGQGLRDGRTFLEGTEDETLASPYRCVFKRIEPTWISAVLPAAAWFYGGRDFPAVQLFWPDRAHRFPWEEHFDGQLQTFQPLLFHADAESARAAGLRG